jgi:uncharacterized protein YjiS (DUF1127 family)
MTISTLKSRKHIVASAAFDRLAVFIETLPDRILALLYTWQARVTGRHRLNQMDDRFLVDIGLDRTDINHEASKPFWRE